jgi:hypothetical protein
MERSTPFYVNFTTTENDHTFVALVYHGSYQSSPEQFERYFTLALEGEVENATEGWGLEDVFDRLKSQGWSIIPIIPTLELRH